MSCRCLAHTEEHYFGYDTFMVHSSRACYNNTLNKVKLCSSIPFLGTRMALSALKEPDDPEMPFTYKARLYIALIPVVNTLVLVPADLFFTAVHHAGALLSSDSGYCEIS